MDISNLFCFLWGNCVWQPVCFSLDRSLQHVMSYLAQSLQYKEYKEKIDRQKENEDRALYIIYYSMNTIVVV